MKRRDKTVGFTLIEMLVTLALIGVAAAVVYPIASLTTARAKESELRVALMTIRSAIDAYKAAADSGAIDKPTGGSGYPPSLDVLVTGVPKSSSMGVGSTPLVFLRRVPRDPFDTATDQPPASSWNLRAYGAGATDFRPGKDVFDVSSKSRRLALDGSRLSDW